MPVRRRASSISTRASMIAAVVVAASCATSTSAPIANRVLPPPPPPAPPLVQGTLRVVVAAEPVVQGKIRREIEGWLRRRGYGAAQIDTSSLSPDVVTKLADCMKELDWACILKAKRGVASDHLVLARAVTDRNTLALEISVGWFGAGPGATAGICNACDDERWAAQLADGLSHIATFIEELSKNHGTKPTQTVSTPQKE